MKGGDQGNLYQVRVEEQGEGREGMSKQAANFFQIKQLGVNREVVSQNSFSWKVINMWNKLPGEAAETKAVHELKRHLDLFQEKRGIRGFLWKPECWD